MTTPIFSALNRITIELIRAKAKGKSLCRGAFGTQTDCQCLGYDSVCALAVLFYPHRECNGSYRAIALAQDEIRVSAYSRGFQRGWDGLISDYGVTAADRADPEYQLGYEDGKAAAGEIEWNGTHANNIFAR